MLCALLSLFGLVNSYQKQQLSQDFTSHYFKFFICENHIYYEKVKYFKVKIRYSLKDLSKISVMSCISSRLNRTYSETSFESVKTRLSRKSWKLYALKWSIHFIETWEEISYFSHPKTFMSSASECIANFLSIAGFFLLFILSLIIWNNFGMSVSRFWE